MDPTSIIPSIGQSEPRENGQNKKKERSLVEDVKAIKNIFDKAKMLANPATPWIVGALTLILIFFLFFNNSDSAKGTSGGSGSGNQPTPLVGGNNPTVPSIPGLSISITGPESINNGEDISYTINVTYDKSLAKTLLENIELYATIPTGAVYKPELSSGEPIEPSATPVVWPLSNTKNQHNFTVVLHPDVVDAYISFTIAARVVGGGTGSLVGLLPSSTVSTPEIDVQHQAIATKIKSLTELVRAYQDAEKVTGMPWQILAGIHYREGGLDPNGSLVS